MLLLAPTRSEELGRIRGAADKKVEEPKPTPEKAKDTAPKQIAIPDVVGKKLEEAKQAIQDAEFAFTLETLRSNKPSGTVVSTDPTPGTLLDPSSLKKVAIRQSSGPPESAKGPDVADENAEETEPEPPPPPTDEKAEEPKPKSLPPGTKAGGSKPEPPSGAKVIVNSAQQS